MKKVSKGYYTYEINGTIAQLYRLKNKNQCKLIVFNWQLPENYRNKNRFEHETTVKTIKEAKEKTEEIDYRCF